ncbi:hypothetical protein MNBD_CHLOROFLEXI01-2559 [hydrothermal vent metagenome]|uniref:Uncharacterized protein n=1 Tax=hydrothermal vent metagenome TaxID=652676 RepID=A0A3B0WEK7_9ZZZZ
MLPSVRMFAPLHHNLHSLTDIKLKPRGAINVVLSLNLLELDSSFQLDDDFDILQQSVTFFWVEGLRRTHKV